jgi:predicted dehydrogenase
MNQPIRIAVAGLGRIGWDFHCAEIARHREFVLAAVADPDTERRRQAEATYSCRAFESYDRMIEDTPLDAVVIATPTHLHRPMAVAAFRKGLHVFLEKPMAPDVAEARQILSAARKARRVLTVYQPRRADPVFQRLLKIVKSGRIGQPYHVRVGCFRYVRRDDWQSLMKYGGGMLNNYGAHFLDQLLCLTGQHVKRMFCQLRRVATLGDADDAVKVVYETIDGVTAELDINMGSLIDPFEMEVYGTRGAITCRKQMLTVRCLPKGRLPAKRIQRGLASEGRKYPADQLAIREEQIRADPGDAVDVYRDLARAIRSGKRPFVTPEETVFLMELIHRCRQDAGPIIENRK